MKLAGVIVLCFYFLAHCAAEEKESSDVTITQNINDDDSEFANILLDMLVKKPILDEATAARLLATFKVKGVNRKTDGAAAFTKADIGTMTIQGNPDASKKFKNSLTSLFDQDKQGQRLVEYLLELALDNDLIDEKAAGQLAADNGYGVSIQTTRYSSSTNEIEVKPVPRSTTTKAPTPAPTPAPTAAPAPAKDGCCRRNLVPLYRLYAPQYVTHWYTPSIYHASYHSTLNPIRFYMEGSPGRVASSATDNCGCAGPAYIKINVMYVPPGGAFKTGKHIYAKDDEVAAYAKQGYQNNLLPNFYCATTAGQCGATIPLRRIPNGQGQILSHQPKEVAGQGSTLCYIWPHPSEPATWTKMNIYGTNGGEF